jgi:hypothetical protein
MKCREEVFSRGDVFMAWNDPDRQDIAIYKVVVNQSDIQYSRHPKTIHWDGEMPGKLAQTPNALAYIEEM